MILDDNDLVACICEGPTEEWILDILLRENKLFFSRENLLDDKIFTGSKYRNPDNFILVQAKESVDSQKFHRV